MKTALVFISNEDRIGKDLSFYTEIFRDGAIDLDIIEVLKEKDDIRFKKRLSEFKDTVDLLVVADGAKGAKIKTAIAETLDAPLVENDNAKRFAEAVGAAEHRAVEEHYSMLPLESSVVPNLRGKYQGFILDKEDFMVAGLPLVKEEFKTMAESYLFPYLEKKYSLKRKKVVLKYFGEREKLFKELDSAKADTRCDFDVNVTEKYGDFTVELYFSDANGTEKSAVVQHVVSALKEEIYAEEEKTLSERLFDCLTVKNKRISVAESFTGGRVSADIVKNSGVSEYFIEGIVSYSNDSKETRLDVKREHLIRDGAVSSAVAYDMAVGLLKTHKTDVAVATTGIAGPNSDDTGKPVGLCYIAVGTISGVHTYRYVFKGDREEITETAKNTALFLTIKNLKRM